MKKIFAAIGVLLIITGAYFTFRRSAPLSDQAQISRELDNAESALEARSAGRLKKILAKNFEWEGNDRKQFDALLVGAMFQWRDVEISRNGETIAVRGDEATVSGNYAFRYRPELGAPYEMRGGLYVLKMHREDGIWKLVYASEGLK